MTLPPVIRRQRVIPVARGLSAPTAPALADALQAGGIGSIEVTVEGAGGVGAISSLADRGIVVGAGTIVTVAQAEAAAGAGAVFLVSPHFDASLLVWANDNGIAMIPGAFTPTEVAAAGAHLPAAIKIFPAHVGGPGYLKSLLGPYPDLQLIPTGGVDAGNLAQYLDAGAVAVGVGGWLTGHDDMSLVTRRAAELMGRVV